MEQLELFKKESKFIKFCIENEEKILGCLIKAFLSICPSMNKNDNRFDIGKIFHKVLKKEFNRFFEVVETNGYDFLFLESGERISIKSLTNPYERSHKRNLNKFTKPKSIIISNNMIGSDSNFTYPSNFDCLFVIGRMDNGVRFSTVEREKICENMYRVPGGWRARISIDKWTFISNVKLINEIDKINYFELEKNYEKSENLKWNNILSFFYKSEDV